MVTRSLFPLSALAVFAALTLTSCTPQAAAPPQQHTFSGDDRIAQQALQRMPAGTIEIQYAPEMQVGESQTISADVYDSVQRAIAQGAKDIAAAHHQRIDTQSIRVAQQMKGQLVYDPEQFHVVDKQSAQEYYSFDPDSHKISWGWEVKPLVSGSALPLTVVVTARVSSSAGSREIRVWQDFPIAVKASAFYRLKTFLADNLKYIITTLIALAGVWLAYSRGTAKKGASS